MPDAVITGALATISKLRQSLERIQDLAADPQTPEYAARALDRIADECERGLGLPNGRDDVDDLTDRRFFTSLLQSALSSSSFA